MRKIVWFVCFTAIYSQMSAQLVEPSAADTIRQVDLSNLKNDGKTMIALVMGQSNAANNGKVPYTPHNVSVLNYYKGKLYTAKDPLMGNTSTGGSVWTHLSDMLIDSGLYNKVIFIPVAVGGSSIDCWVSGDCSERLKQTLMTLKQQQIQVTHIFWHQGETDNLLNTTSAQYKERITTILQTVRKYNQTANFYVSLASYHPSAIAKPLGVDSVIRKAQKEFINENKGVLEGPDTDTLIHAIHRYDSVHFSDFGMKAYAQLWLNSIINKNEKCLHL